jgi:hypothetical protein
LIENKPSLISISPQSQISLEMVYPNLNLKYFTERNAKIIGMRLSIELAL